jgi:hypothetical protein
VAAHRYVTARPAHDGETIDTLEGPVTAMESDWVIKGSRGERWVVGAQIFARRYQPADCPPVSAE